MNIVYRPSTKLTRSEPVDRHPKNSEDLQKAELGEWLANLWEDRFLIICSMVFMLMVGWFYAWRSTPIFQAESMLQVQPKKTEASDAAFVKMQNLFSGTSDAQSEVEILKSNEVLGNTVNALKLDIVAEPKVLPIIGKALHRDDAEISRLEMDFFEIPDELRGQQFVLTALPGDRFRVDSAGGAAIAQGSVGELVRGLFHGQPINILVRKLFARPRQEFILTRKPILNAINDLRISFDAFEKGKMSNVIGLTLKNPDPVRASAILNEIINQYIKKKVAMKSAETSQTLAILQGKMPELKAQLDVAENRLNEFRTRTKSVDLTRESDIVMQQSANLNSQISSLIQKKDDLLRTYKEDSDVVATLNQQIAKLRAEAGQADANIRSLPARQQEMVRLSRDVQVNTELYTALLNNIQQLQVARAGEISDVTVVDPAKPNLDPIGPKPLVLVAFFGCLGLLISTGLIMVRRALRRGVKDQRLIETKLGIPVLVTIPHSKVQEKHANAIARRSDGVHLLAMDTSDDLATESLRSLRTTLHFAMKSARNGVIMITGPSPSIGKSFVSSNLSTVLAQAGASVLLVDGDLRKGNMHLYFGLKNRMAGLSEVLTGRASWRENLRKTEIQGLHLLSTGVLPPDPSELLMTSRFSQFIQEVSEAYDFVIVDAPPLLAVTDATIIGSAAGTVLLVAKYGQHPLDEIRTCQRRLESNGIHLNGCVFNDLEQIGLGYNYSTYRYAYHYKYK